MEKLQSILNYSVGSFTVGKIFEAVIVFVICYFLIRIIMKVLKRVLGKTSLDATLSKIITAVIKIYSLFHNRNNSYRYARRLRNFACGGVLGGRPCRISRRSGFAFKPCKRHYDTCRKAV